MLYINDKIGPFGEIFKLNAHDRHYGPFVEREKFYKKIKCKI